MEDNNVGEADFQQLILHEVKYFYDLQKLRISASNRKVSDSVQLEKKSIEYLNDRGDAFNAMERKSLSEIKRLLKHHKMHKWLDEQKGCGPTMSGVICSTFDIHRAPTPSAFWAYAGLHVDSSTGKSVRRKRGEKLNYNPFLKAKLLKVLADCFIKSRSPWTEHYYNYKNRKKNEIVKICEACNGTGKIKSISSGESESDVGKATASSGKLVTCKNCNGTGGPAPWGKSDAHRDMAARRYMIKAFLRELWKEWRIAEGLPVVDTYAEAYLGRRHGDHQGSMHQSMH